MKAFWTPGTSAAPQPFAGLARGLGKFAVDPEMSWRVLEDSNL